MKRFSEMSEEELQKEIERLQSAMERCAHEGERDVLRQRWLLARSYAVRNRPFPQGRYRVEDETRIFVLSYLNGVMAWGRWEDGEEAAVPISALTLLTPDQ